MAFRIVNVDETVANEIDRLRAENARLREDLERERRTAGRLALIAQQFDAYGIEARTMHSDCLLDKLQIEQEFAKLEVENARLREALEAIGRSLASVYGCGKGGVDAAKAILRDALAKVKP